MSNTRVFFISDLHIGHNNLLDFRSEVHKKLFPTVGHWFDWLQENWNSTIRARDIVWVLGDIAMGDDNLQLMHVLNGHKRLVLGNHDGHDMRKYLPIFERITGVTSRYGFVMSHVPMHPQELEYRSWTHNVHGHIHHKDRNIKDSRYINVNVDVRGCMPVSLEQIREEIENAAS